MWKYIRPALAVAVVFGFAIVFGLVMRFWGHILGEGWAAAFLLALVAAGMYWGFYKSVQ